MKLLYNLTRHINEPTRGNKVLDHIISNSPIKLNIAVLFPARKSVTMTLHTLSFIPNRESTNQDTNTYAR